MPNDELGTLTTSKLKALKAVTERNLLGDLLSKKQRTDFAEFRQELKGELARRN